MLRAAACITLIGMLSLATATADATPRALGFTCPFPAKKLDGLVKPATGFHLVAFQNQNDGLHGTCIFVDPEPAVHSLLAGDRRFTVTFTKGLQTVRHEIGAWRATPGWKVTTASDVGPGAFEAQLHARSAASTNQLMLSFAAASGGSWGITIGTHTDVHLTTKQLDTLLRAIRAARTGW